MKRYTVFSLFLILALLVITNVVTANVDQQDSSQPKVDLTAFQQYRDVPAPKIKVPTVVAVPFDKAQAGSIFVVHDNFGKVFIPSYLKSLSKYAPISYYISTAYSKIPEVTDNNFSTYHEFGLPVGNTQGRVVLKISGFSAITSSALNLMLDNNVALPNTIGINVLINREEKVVLSPTYMNSQVVSFPKTTASEWIITLTYSQPLRIAEMKLNQENNEAAELNTLRFLAQPGHDYRIYFNADRPIQNNFGEMGDLASDKGVLTVNASPVVNNVFYKQADSDSDGIPDLMDNCVSVANPDQIDVDGNLRGDVCDDFDKDGVINSIDNCPNQPNYNQSDVDGDKIGDVCDSQESRLTEKYSFLPWVGIGFAGLLIIGMLFMMMKGIIKPVSK